MAVDRQTENQDHGKNRISADQQSSDQGDGGAGLNNNTLGNNAMPAQGISGSDTSATGAGESGGGTTGRATGEQDITGRNLGSDVEAAASGHVGGPVRSSNNSAIGDGDAEGIHGSDSGSTPQESGGNLTTAPAPGKDTGGMLASSDTTTLASATRDQDDSRSAGGTA